MKPSTVYFADFRTDFSETLPMKFSRLIRESGIDQIDFDRKFVAIKIHFGEAGNLAHLRPAYARTLAGEIKRLGGKPFLTDCNTLYRREKERDRPFDLRRDEWLQSFDHRLPKYHR